MGYAIFTARKLMLTNRINQVNFRILQLCQQQQTLADNAAKMERAIANTKNLFANIGNAISMSQQMASNALSAQLMQNIQGGKSIDQSTISQLGSLLGGGGLFSSPAGIALNLLNQTLDLTNQNQLRQIKEMENQIELEKKNLETQQKAMMAERDAIEKAEEKEIQNSAPKFA